jgi:hypothetical protein
VAMVLPRSFMTADQHHATRAGQIKGLRINRIWDLKDVKPLFRVPCCVLFAVPEESTEARGLPAAGIRGSPLRVRSRPATCTTNGRHLTSPTCRRSGSTRL